MDSVTRGIYHYFHTRQIGCLQKSSKKYQNLIQDSLWGWIYGDRTKKLKKHEDMERSGGIFNLKYSLDGEVLIAVCENNSFILIDPVSEKVINVKDNAHTDCCNYVTFIDDRLFATCSDDCSVAIWDLRNMQREVHRLTGHTAWVKNIEYDKSSKTLVSAGFDSKILAWNLNGADANGSIQFKEIMEVLGLCRMKLSSCGKSMYISSVYIPHIVAIHNVNLMSMQTDIGLIKRVHISDKESEYFAADTKLTCEQRTMHHMKPNHVELYRIEEENDLPVLAHSIDVHPRNSAILLHQLSDNNNRTVIRNTKCHYDYAYERQNEEQSEYSFVRGCETHVMEFDNGQDAQYFEEVSFSACGKFFAFPLRYGVCLAGFDEKCSHYETFMASHLQSLVSSSGQYKGNGLVPDVTKPEILCSSFGHSAPVLCTAFSPRHIQLVTGCQAGKIVFHNPYL